ARFLLSHSDLKYNMSNKYGTTALIVAASYGSLEIVKLLLEKDININAVASGLRPPVSVLSAAAKSGHGKIVELLLNHRGLDQKHLGMGLIAATEAGRTEIIRQILQANSDVAELSGSTCTALLIAARRGHKKAVEELLIDTRVDVNAGDACGNTALHYATSREDLELTEILL
ncbi:Ankyrin repeat-containing domain protein, partial [Elaphomyces granulatus]